MQANYGTRWVSQTGTGNALKLAFTVWTEKLAGLSDEQIKYGLDNLPEDFPPTPAKFKSICINTAKGLSHNTAAYLPYKKPKSLPAPKDTSLARKSLARMKRMLKGDRNIDTVNA